MLCRLTVDSYLDWLGPAGVGGGDVGEGGGEGGGAGDTAGARVVCRGHITAVSPALLHYQPVLTIKV